MHEAEIIVLVEEFEWLTPMVVHGKKTNGIRIHVDLRYLNATCIHNPFPTPFIDEVLENMGAREP